jgi:hypothetical protein
MKKILSSHLSRESCIMGLEIDKRKMMFCTAVRILKTSIGIRSNKKTMLPSLPFGVKVESLLTDFRRVEEISYSEALDGYIFIEDKKGIPSYGFQEKAVSFTGPFSQLQNEATDSRFTLWGNQGFLYRYALYLLEKKHGIYNCHACALYQEDRDILYVIIGGAGSGKTVYLLSGLEKGLKLFSTETVHFKLDNGNIIWFMGSLVDNVRYGTLIHDFPRFLPPGEIPDPQNIWQTKIAIDLSSYCAQIDTLTNPRTVHILFPRIENGFERTFWHPVKDTDKAIKNLFDNITQKLSETILLYDKMPVLGLDERDLASGRLKSVQDLVIHETVVEISEVLSNPRNCWGDILN